MQESRKSKMKSRADNFCEDFLEFHSLPTQWNYRVIDWMPGVSNRRFTEAGETIFLRELKKEVAETLQESNMHPQHKWQFVNKLVDAFRNKYQQADVSSSLAARTKEVLTQAFNEHLNNLRDKPEEVKASYKTELQTKLPYYFQQFFNTTDKAIKSRCEKNIRAIFASVRYGLEQQLLSREELLPLVEKAKENVFAYLETEINVLKAKQTSPLSGKKINSLSQAEEAKLGLLRKAHAAAKKEFNQIEKTRTRVIKAVETDKRLQPISLTDKLFNNQLVSMVTSYGKGFVAGVDYAFSNQVTKSLWNTVKRVGGYTTNLASSPMKWVMENPGKFYVFATLGMAVAARAYASVQVDYDGCHAGSRIVNNGISYTNSTYVCFRPIQNWLPSGDQICYSYTASSLSTTMIYDAFRDSYFINAGRFEQRIWEVNTTGALKNIINSTITDPTSWGLCKGISISTDRNLALISNINHTLYTETYTIDGAKLAGPKNITSARSGHYSCSIEKREVGDYHALYHVENTVSRVDYIRIDALTGDLVAQHQGINTNEVATYTKSPSFTIKETASNRVIIIYPGSSGQVYLQVLDGDGKVIDAFGNNNKNEIQVNRFRNFSSAAISLAVIDSINKTRIFIAGVSTDDSKLYGMMYQAIDASGNSYEKLSGDPQKVEFLISNDESYITSAISVYCDTANCGVVYSNKLIPCRVNLISLPINGPFEYYGISPSTQSPVNLPGTPKAPGSGSFPTGAVVGGSIAGLLLVVGAVVVGVVCNQRKRDDNFKEVKEVSEEENIEELVDVGITLKYKEGTTIFKNSNPLFHMILCWLSRPGVKYMTSLESGDGKEAKELLSNLKRQLIAKGVNNFNDDNTDKKKLAEAIARGIVNAPGIDYLDKFEKLNYVLLKDNIGSVVTSIYERLTQDGLLSQQMHLTR